MADSTKIVTGKAIGGYFNLELDSRGAFPHDEGILLNTGRNAIEYILRSLGNVTHVYVPYYTCIVVIEPLQKLGIDFSYYHIDKNLEIAEPISVAEGEYIIYTNYFGLKDKYVRELIESGIYKDRLIVDNAMAYYAPAWKDVPTAYCPRKFVGIPDGGIAYINNGIDVQEVDVSYDRVSHLIKRYDLDAEGGYQDFHVNEDGLMGQPIKRMSQFTQALMKSIDYEHVKSLRKRNFAILHKALAGSNALCLPEPDTYECPLIYPYLCNDEGLKKYLISKRIYVATYWPNTYDWCKPEDWERHLADCCLALPIDQRYDEADMQRIIDLIENYNTNMRDYERSNTLRGGGG